MNGQHPPIATLIGRRLRRQRVKLGLSARCVADAVGLAVSSLSNIEAGQRSPSLHVLVRLSKELSLPVAEILDGAPEKLGRKIHARLFSADDQPGLQLQRLTDPKEPRVAIIDSSLAFGPPCHIDGLVGVLTAIQKSGISILRCNEEEHVIRAGDALTISHGRPLTWLNGGREPSSVLWIGRPGYTMGNIFHIKRHE